MKVKTSELSGSALNYAVSIAEGFKATLVRGAVILDGEYTEELAHIPLPNYGKRYSPAYLPSTNWSQGGPLIEKQIKAGFEIAPINAGKVACSNYTDEGIPYSGNWDTPEIREHGDTPLIAACRAIVAAKLGDTVDIPEELL